MLLAVGSIGIVLGFMVQVRHILNLRKEYESRARTHWLRLLNYDDVYDDNRPPTPQQIRTSIGTR